MKAGKCDSKRKKEKTIAIGPNIVDSDDGISRQGLQDQLF